MTVTLDGVPETMLWTLHNRANEAKRRDGVLVDPAAVKIYEEIAYPYERKFGAPDGSHADRARLFDKQVRPWLEAHPGGTVVELGCGLETEFQRVDDGRVRWLCVDVPDAIDVRARFLPETERCSYLRISALDLAWMDHVDAARGVLVTAQGLFMYLGEADVKRLVIAIVERFPGVELVFDAIPPWLSALTLTGWRRTPEYQAPPMPWGIPASEIEPTLQRWSPKVSRVATTFYGPTRGLQRAVFAMRTRVPIARDIERSIAHVWTRPVSGQHVR